MVILHTLPPMKNQSLKFVGLQLAMVAIVLCFASAASAQASQLKLSNDIFRSVFVSMKRGSFAATANGVLFAKDVNDHDLILDFQGSPGKLVIEPDADEVYDVSTKHYTAQSTSGKTKVTYDTYNMANVLNIEVQGDVFQVGSIDGASDMVIDGLDYYYRAEKETEYLVLFVTQNLVLNNHWAMMKRYNYDYDKMEKSGEKMKTITLLPHSTLVMAVKR